MKKQSEKLKPNKQIATKGKPSLLKMGKCLLLFFAAVSTLGLSAFNNQISAKERPKHTQPIPPKATRQGIQSAKTPIIRRPDKPPKDIPQIYILTAKPACSGLEWLLA